MNKKYVISLMGRLLLTEGILLLLPALVSLIYGEFHTMKCFLIVGGALILVMIPVSLMKSENKELFSRDGFVIVGLCWILWSLIGCLPMYFSGQIPDFIDCFFETVSGFTTTGASALTNIEALDHGILFWRSFTHFIGGMGVLVFVMAILPLSEDNSSYLMRAEVPGPTFGKLVPKGKSTARILYLIYIALTLLLIVLLKLGGLNWFDSFIHGFGTAGTGGFSNYSESIGHFNSLYVEIVITVFMLIFSFNFNMFYLIILKRFAGIKTNSEWKVFLCIVFLGILALTLTMKNTYGSFWTSLRYSSFQYIAVISTTGYATADFNLWPTFTKAILMGTMIIGGCSGSTAGGIKVQRLMLTFKTVKREIKKLLHPRSVSVVRFCGKPVSESVIMGLCMYVIIYVVTACISILIISLNGFDLETTISSVITCLNDVGPGFNVCGPMGGYADFSVLSKLVLCVCMMAGRLDFFPLLILISPSTWKKNN